MDPLISDKLDMNSSHGGKCDPAHHDARADGSSPSRAGARGRGAQRWAQRAAAQVPTQPRPGDPSWCLLVHILGKIPLRGPCPPLLPLPRPLGLACPACRTRWCLPLSVSARGDGAVPPGRCLLRSPQAQQCLKDPPGTPGHGEVMCSDWESPDMGENRCWGCWAEGNRWGWAQSTGAHSSPRAAPGAAAGAVLAWEPFSPFLWAPQLGPGSSDG